MSETTSGTEDKSDRADRKRVVRPKPPFLLCFSSRLQPGRSHVTPGQPRMQVPIVTSKFYSAHETSEDATAIAQHLRELQDAYRTCPKESFKLPVLESHRYGWYSDPLITVDRRDRRLHHGIAPCEMVRTQCELSLLK